jgi:murein DD-endopeptidase MepM/ murein hydrolase activator NlpD
LKFLKEFKIFREKLKLYLRIKKNFFLEIRHKLEAKGSENLTIILVPHSHQKSFSWKITYRSIGLISAGTILFISFFAFLALRQSTITHQVQELEASNQDFLVQSQKIKQEQAILHDVVDEYSNRIFKLYLKLGGDVNKIPYGNFQKEILFESQKENIPSDLARSENLNLDVPNSNINSETYRFTNDAYKLKLTDELSQQIIQIIKDRNKIIRNTPSLWPTKGYVLHPFGNYFDSSIGKEVFNSGIDIGCFPGSEVISTAPGIVYDIGRSDSTGYFVKIEHKYGWKTIYSNLERLQVKKNQQISKGDLLAYVAKLPGSYHNYLHYEVHVGTNPLNPYSFLNQIQN